MNERSFIYCGGRLMIDTREKILKSARQVIANKGFPSASIKEIAEKAGIAQGTLYLHFKNKEDLYIELLLALADRMDEILNENFFSTEKDIWTKLEGAVEQIAVYFNSNKDVLKIMIGSELLFGINSKARTKILQLRESKRKKIETLFKMNRKNGIVNKNFTDQEHAELCMIVMEGMLKMILVERDKKSPAYISAVVVKVLKLSFTGKI